jgi:hypothetical protein
MVNGSFREEVIAMASDSGSEFSRLERVQLHTGDPVLSIYTNGDGRFNVHAVGRWLEDVDRVEFYTDIKTTRLWITLDEEDQHSYSLSATAGGGLSISMRAVLRKFGVDYAALDSAVRCPLEYDEQEGLLIADLQPVVDAVGGRDG